MVSHKKMEKHCPNNKIPDHDDNQKEEEDLILSHVQLTILLLFGFPSVTESPMTDGVDEPQC